MKEKINLFLEKYGSSIRETKGWAFYSLLVVIWLLPMGTLLCLIALYIRWREVLIKKP
ncbi:MAG: hypothetical protein ACPHUE_04830 [Flavobacteriaceae bacterium]